uniref:Uncharacterized protein n=1 Tax=Ignisphaera aggregans TaxID=334771 RepID=A0A7C2ZCH9_9CREN
MVLPGCLDKDPLQLTEEEIDKLNIEECIWKYYREILRKKPRKKSYWQREMEYRERVMKALEEIELYRKLVK